MTPDHWGARFDRERPTYVGLSAKLATLIADLLQDGGIEVVQIEKRAKSVDSFVSKIRRKSDKYVDPLSEMTDLAGVRVIAYYLEDVEAIGEVIRREFEIDADNTLRKGSDLDPSQFAYVSDHYVVRLNESRRNLTEWSSFGGLSAEIQVRTTTQHAWAAIEHKLRYKTAPGMPPEVSRRLYRLNALFELADEQFSEVRRATRALEETYAENVREGNLAVPVDVSSLAAYAAESPVVASALSVAEANGWAITAAPPDAEPDRQARDRKDLVRALTTAQYSELGSFEALLRRAEEAGPSLRSISEALNADAGAGSVRAAFPEDLLNMIFFVLHPASRDDIQDVYDEETTDAIIDSRSLLPQH